MEKKRGKEERTKERKSGTRSGGEDGGTGAGFMEGLWPLPDEEKGAFRELYGVGITRVFHQ